MTKLLHLLFKNQTQWLNVKFTKMTKIEPQRKCNKKNKKNLTTCILYVHAIQAKRYQHFYLAALPKEQMQYIYWKYVVIFSHTTTETHESRCSVTTRTSSSAMFQNVAACSKGLRLRHCGPLSSLGWRCDVIWVECWLRKKVRLRGWSVGLCRLRGWL